MVVMENSASSMIDQRIRELDDWRGSVLKRMRELIHEADPASLKDPAQLFNSSLGGNTRRAIDIREDDAIDEPAFKELIRAAVAFNAAKRKK